MSNVEVTRDAPRKPLPPIDPNVKVPDSVKKGAEIAEAFYKPQAAPQAQETVQLQPEPAPASPTSPPTAEVPAEAAPAQAPAPAQPGTTVNEPDSTPTPSKSDLQESEWARRYNSMKGRFDASQNTITTLQDQVQQLGDELSRAINLLNSRAPQQTQPTEPAQPLITEQDVDNYGNDLIDLAKRAAREAVNPQLSQLEQENQALKQKLQSDAKKAMFSALDMQIPEWRQINRDPRFKRWLSLPDIYTGHIKGQLLNAAFNAADAPRVAAFFKGFISDGVATGHVEPAPQTEQPPQSAPRQAAVQLETLAAPGRARSASDPASVPTSKPVFTRTQISAFYRDVRAGAYAGREQEKTQIEREIFAAQNEGRIR